MNSINKKIIQITSGRGPIECEWAVAHVFKQLTLEIEKEKIPYKVIESTLGQLTGTLQTVSLEISGSENQLNLFLSTWLGAIQYIGKSPYRKLHKRKNWFIGIFEITGLKETTILEKDIEYQAVRARGAGGQNVNKVNTAVRATHLPTQTSVFAMDSRSQFQNKKLARERLIEKLTEVNFEKIKEQIQEQWNNQLNIQRGNPIRVITHKN